MARTARAKADTGASVGFEGRLWQTADALRNNMDAAEYKHVVPGLIFLKYISDAFEARHQELVADRAFGADPEDPDEYRAASISWVPREARWTALKASAPQPTIGTLVDDAMTAIERDNPTLMGVLPKDCTRPGLDKARLGQLIEELIALAREMRTAGERGVELGLSEDELAFYDALETNDSAVAVLGEPELLAIARELTASVRANVTIDWTIRDDVRAQLRVLVKRILRKHGYPPDKQEQATRTVLEQAEVLSELWAAA